MHYGLSVLCFIGWCEVSAWHLLYVCWQYVGLSVKHVLQAFITGCIIKSGFWTIHHLTPTKYVQGKKKGTALSTLSALGSVIDEK